MPLFKSKFASSPFLLCVVGATALAGCGSGGPSRLAANAMVENHGEENHGHVTYYLYRDPQAAPDVAAINDRIAQSMDEAVAYYNKYTTITKHIDVSFVRGVPTAQGSAGSSMDDKGSIQFGTLFSTRVALHEIGHTMGVGTLWGDLSRGGRYVGERGSKLVKELDGPDAVVYADNQHFWPYGLNLDNENAEAFFIKHCKMVQAIYDDIRQARGGV